MKYELTDETTSIEGFTLHRIQALKDFGDVKAGDLGGFIQSESNLSQDGDCWVYDDAKVFDSGLVMNNAKVKDKAIVMDFASAMDDSVICDEVCLSNNAKIYGNAKMFGQSKAYHNAEIFGDIKILDQVRVLRDAWVYGDFSIHGKANVTEKTTKAPIVMMGLAYTVTIMDSQISFDCQTKTTLEWYEISDEELMVMDKIKAVRFFRKYRELIKSIADIHQENQSNL